MPDLRSYQFLQELRWPDGTLVLTAVQVDETHEPKAVITEEYSAVEFEEEKVPFIEISLLSSQLIQTLDLESFDGWQFNGKQYECREKRSVLQEPPRIVLIGFVVGQVPLPEVEDV